MDSNRAVINKLKSITFSLMEFFIRNISGGLGIKIRYFYYKNRFKSCGVNVRIEENVLFYNPDNIVVGNDVLFMHNSSITAKPLGLKITNRIETKITNLDFKGKSGSLTIGNEVGIGPYNIIQSYGGVNIKDKVTLSARVSIYSYSHCPNDKTDLSRITYANAMVKTDAISCIESPIVIEEAAWLGLNVIVFGGTIGKNSFVTTNSIVMSNLQENSYASGSPAKKIKNRFDYETK
jgi:acetyltransferase-like isoleucine patch superfamily enzyme